MEKTEREISFSILDEIYNNDGYSNIVINSYLKDETDKRKENLVRQIVYGVLENNIYIDYVISKASNIKMKKIHPNILIILRLCHLTFIILLFMYSYLCLLFINMY